MSTLKVNNITDLGDEYPGSLAYPGQILQVVSTITTEPFTTTSTSYVDITDLSVSITPTSASSKVLVLISVEGASTTATASSTAAVQLVRDSTPIGIGTNVGNRTAATGLITTRNTGADAITMAFTKSILDEPATTSTVTYKAQAMTHAGTAYVNRTQNDADTTAGYIRPVSTITLMEVAG